MNRPLMKATSVKAIFIAAILLFPAWGFAQTKSKDAAAYANSGIAKLQKRDFDGAIADFNRALQFDPKLVKAYAARGVAKHRKGDLDGAIADYNRALELDPKLAPAYGDRGGAKALKGDAGNAIADFNHALQLDPKFARAYDGRASAQFLAHNWATALSDYRRFCELSQRSQQYARFGIWMIRSRLGEREQADKELAAHFNAEPGSWPSKIQAYLLGKLAESEFLAAVSPDIKIDPGQRCEAWFYAGTKNLLDGNKPAAVEFFKKCIATGRKSVANTRLRKPN